MRIRHLVLRALLVSATFTTSAWVHSQENNAPPAPLVDVDAVKAEMITARIWVPGTVLSITDSELASEVAGRIMWMAEVGDRVKQGEPLIKLNDKRLTIDLAQETANIAISEARVDLLTSRLNRFSSMAKMQNTSQDELDGVRSELEVAKQELEQAKSRVELIKYEIDQSTVTAPFDTLVVERIQSPGEFTSVGQVLMRVVDPTRLEASVRAPLSVIPYLQAGMQVPVKSGQAEGLQTLKTVVPVGNERSRMMELRIALDPEQFIIGSAMRVGLPNSKAHYGHTVPRDALVLRKSGTFIYQLDNENLAQQVQVDTGAGLGDRVEVISNDVIADSLVVVRGAERLKNGDKVRVNEKTSDLVARQ